MAGTSQPLQPPSSRFPRWFVALALGVGAFLVATPFISAETAAAAGIAAGVVAALAAVFGPPSWATVRAMVRPRRVAAVLVLVLVGGVGHAQLAAE